MKGHPVQSNLTTAKLSSVTAEKVLTQFEVNRP